MCVPWRRSENENRKAKPSPTSSSCETNATAATMTAIRYRPGRRISRSTVIPRMMKTAATTSHGCRVPKVVGGEERRERDHDRVVEEEYPAGHEPDRIVERAAGEHRGAARLGDRGGALGV